MIKGLAITPPVLGRISIGHVVERNGKRLPEKDDQFTITSQIKNKDGDWLVHPVDQQLREQQNTSKLRRIPIRFLFDDPDLNLRAEYTLFDRDSARPMCVGNGDVCRRAGPDGIVSLECPSPSACDLGHKQHCKPYGRLNVVIGDDDPMGTFVFRTTGFNSIRTLAARLNYFRAISGNRLACMPLELQLRGKSTRQSYWTTIYYVDITLRQGTSLIETLQQTHEFQQERISAGFQQSDLDAAAKQGLANGAFEDSSEDAPEIIEEFYADPATATAASPAASINDKLTQRLEKLQRHPTRSNGQQPPVPQ